MSWFRRKYVATNPVFRDVDYNNTPTFAFEKSDAKNLTFTADGRLVAVRLEASLCETSRGGIAKTLACSVLELDGEPVESPTQNRTRQSCLIDEDTPLVEQYKVLIEATLQQFGISGGIMPASKEFIDDYQGVHKLRQRVGRRGCKDVSA